MSITVWAYVNISKQAGWRPPSSQGVCECRRRGRNTIPKTWPLSVRFWNRWMRPDSVQLRNERDPHPFSLGEIKQNPRETK